MSNIVIRVENLGKKYRISHQHERQRYLALRDVLADRLLAPKRWIKSQISRVDGRAASNSAYSGSGKKEDFWALKDLSFEVERGEVLGVIGRNGAGKSTLLKILSRITEPTEGRARIRGRLASLLEVGAGFHPELTGRENLYLNGAILGMTMAEIRKKFDQIVAFAEVEQFLDTPVKRYSSGMYMRLAFAVAAHLEPEILVVDEVLAVGDAGFQRKCMDYMRKLARSGMTILMVSHNLFVVKAMCRRVLLLSAGRRQFDGSPAEGIELYEKDSRLEADPWAIGVIGENIDRWPLVIRFVEFLDAEGARRTVYDYGERMRVRIHYEVRSPVKYPNFCFEIKRSDNILCCSFSAARDGVTAPLLEKSGVIELLTPPVRLVSELYGTHAIVWDREFKNLYCGQIGPTFHIRDEVLNPEFGVIHEPAEWRWRSNGDCQQIVPATIGEWSTEEQK
ncbi:MAG: ABC transporter ATP-binding protein [Acidobacteria bacterium]|nr:ABC transporter ATP-binding protein [Acidobacteriota bacterium]